MQAQNSLDSKSATLRIIFFTMMVALTVVYLMFNFKGLTSKYGMDQAQIGRQIAEGKSITTKFFRPVAIQQLEGSNKDINFYSFKDRPTLLSIP